MLKSLSGSAEDIFSEESSLKEKYYKVKPTMTEERQKTVDNLFEQLSPSLKKQGQLNDLKKLILKYSEEGANMEDIFSSIEDIFKSQLLGKNARPKMMQQDLQALIEGIENGLSDQKEGSLGSFLSNFIDDMLFMEDQLERSRKISAEYNLFSKFSLEFMYSKVFSLLISSTNLFVSLKVFNSALFFGVILLFSFICI